MYERQKFVFREDSYGEGEAEYDAADFPYTFVEQDGTPVVLISANVENSTFEKIKALLDTLTYTHG